MTTTLSREPVVNDQGGRAADVSVSSLSPPSRRRRPSWIVVGALLVGLAGLLGAYVFSVMSDTLSVTVAAHDIEPGEVLGPEDIRVVEMGRTSELRAVQSNQQELIVGLAARGPIPDGTVLNTGLFVPSEEVIPAGNVVAGAAFEAGAIPTRALGPGDVVRMLQVEPSTASVSAPTEPLVAVLGEAMVWAVEGDTSAETVSDRMWVSLVIDEGVQLEVSQAAADETLRLVLVGES